MKKLLILLIIILTSCEDQYKDLIEDNSTLEIYIDDLEYNNITETYKFQYPNTLSNNYFKITYNTSPYQRVYWDSPDEYYVVTFQDTTWTSVVNYSTHAGENGIGYQMVYVNNSLAGDTLKIVGTTNNNEEVIKIYIASYDPDCYPQFCDENGNYY